MTTSDINLNTGRPDPALFEDEYPEAAAFMQETYKNSPRFPRFDFNHLFRMCYFPQHIHIPFFNPALPPVQNQSRNERCSCGSGKKYKKCCGKALPC